ncbi:flagellar biosynthetic protein FliQ [Microvenator marinus]|jgi:flagellar biosynthetic protein FliQ|uniref:Flagellar biosynthetic protein FliQ n=1 Tax=Microvenator marinus TaxID=2600177 RepID=A0A5B8XYU5_9DELT|nr:flagellar biosynthetic protein FliQ [Microvenator marinus]QED28619.1 flagellar biosynthetic protein FliQ [Microvenator marinus]
MSAEWIIQVIESSLILALTLGGPFMVIALGLGLTISILQAATQVNEMTLSFVPKIVGAGFCLWVGSGWMLEKWVSFTTELISVTALQGMAP